MSEQEQLNEVPPPPGLITCPGCLHTQVEGRNFCESCGAPISSFSTVAPFERVFAEGHMYRRAVSGPPRLLVVVGIWVLLSPTLFMLTALCIQWNSTPLTDILFLLVGILVCATILFKVTANYLSKRKQPCVEE